MAAVPSIGRAARIDPPASPCADRTRSLYERFSGQIFGYCLHQLGSREEAEDAVQTTFMNAFRGLQRGIVPEIESAWLFKIAHNVCLSRRRSTWRRGRVEAPNNMEVLQEVVPAQERSGEDFIGLQDVLEQMPESQRRAILLREWQGLSYREIAEELQLSQPAVETLIFRARRALAAGLEPAPEPAPAPWRRRARHGLDASGLIGALKALITGGAAMKAAATGVAVTTALVLATDAQHRRHTSGVAPAVSQTVVVHDSVTPAFHPSIVRESAPPFSHARTASRHVTHAMKSSAHPVSSPTSSAPPAAAPALQAPASQSAAYRPPKPNPPRGATDEEAPPAGPSVSATSATENHGHGHEKTRVTQATAQPAPPAQSGDEQPQPEQDHGKGHK